MSCQGMSCHVTTRTYVRMYVCFLQMWQCYRLWSGWWISIARRSLVILWSLLVRVVANAAMHEAEMPIGYSVALLRDSFNNLTAPLVRLVPR